MLNNTRNGWRLVTAKTIILFGLIGATLWGIPAFSQVFLMPTNWICNDTKAVIETLRNVKESPLVVGKMPIPGADDALIMSLWASKEGGTWTVTVTSQKYPDRSCIIITGEELFFLERKGLPIKNSI